MIKEFLILGSTAATFFLISPNISGLFIAGVCLEKSLKDINSQNNKSGIATNIFRAIYSVLGIASATFVGTLFNVDIMSSAISIVLGASFSLILDLADYLLFSDKKIPSMKP